MKNIFGTQEDLKLYHKNGELAYEFRVNSDGFSYEWTYDEKGNETSSVKKTLCDQGRVTFYKEINIENVIKECKRRLEAINKLI